MIEMARAVAGWVALTVFALIAAGEEAPEPAPFQEPRKQISEEVGNTVIALSNSFIRIRVNAETEEMGRFAVETTGGDPMRPEDDDKVLLYGHPIPWTSFTTIQIDGQNFGFGGRTMRRAGYGLPTGNVVTAPEISEEGGSIVTTFAFPQEVLVRQRLLLAASPTTGYMDSALVEYTVENLGTTERQVGIRVMLDTMLGSNDGAPLRVGDVAVSSEKCFDGANVPDFIQAFDRLEEPTVVSQGTFRGRDMTPPDTLVVANWGSLADAAWGFECREGASLIREGEDEPDSAVALYWMPRPIPAGESLTIRFLYGLGGLSIGEGKLLLGLTTPLEIPYRRDATESVMVLGYIENDGQALSTNTRLSLKLPRGIAVVAGETDVDLGDLSPGESRQYAWRIRADGSAFGETVLRMEASSETYETNRVTRAIRISGLKRLDAVLVAPEKLQAEDNILSPNPFKAVLRLHNPNDDSVGRVHLKLSLPEGVSVKAPESLTKSIAGLGPRESREIHWLIFGEDGAGSVNLVVQANAEDSYPITTVASVFIPALTPRIRISVYPSEPAEGEYFYLTTYLMSAPGITHGRFEFSYDPKVVKFVRYSLGTLALRPGQRLTVKRGARSGQLTVSFEVAPDAVDPDQESLFSLHFRALRKGDAPVSLVRWETGGPEGPGYLPLFFKGITIK